MVGAGLEGPVAEAARQQRLASDPAISAFVSASAGSGKTKLLIDRLLRLMLPDPSCDRPAASPERILCLTFTKAAAAEMAIRLRRVLGRWVMLDDAALDAELASLDLAASPSQRDAARGLFARVLDVPGGLRIGTIHAFCEQLLRRFPLEAAISPHFRLVEEHDSGAALDRAREHASGLADTATHVASLAARLDALTHSELTRHLHNKADRLVAARALDSEALAAVLARVLDVAHRDEDALVAQAVAAIPEELPATLRAITGRARNDAAKLLDWLSLPRETRAARWCGWRDALFTKEGKPRAYLQSDPVIADEIARVRDLEDRRRALALVEATAALLALCGPSLAAYEAEKRALGLLDFDDLIRRTRELLADPGAAWVLFKLDGGLDHLLLDEVQDTSAAQWAIAGRLTEEFFAGLGAAGTDRTIFAVGDFKQSIYAFQGADPLGFRTWRRIFGERARSAGAGFREPELTVSFRSSPAILAFVDAVFRHPLAAAGVAEPPHPVPAHRSARPHLAGAVELWPLVGGSTDAPPASPWAPADRNRGLASGQQRLAEALAAHLASLIERQEVRPGDILVLVRKRTAFAASLMRALKARAVAVAGLDRMTLTEQPAVADLLALCDALLLPDDDLAVATWLTSPLGGLDDASLMDLALGRPGSLAKALRDRRDERPEWQAADALFGRLLARVDFVSPHALLVDALGAGGRARLLARLGPEAADAIDELLSAALAHAATRIPSMQGFVHWVRAVGAEIKREPAEAADEVRLMTVHGSKGLEGRLVVLADTVSPPRDDDDILWPDDEPVPVWIPHKELRCPPVDRLRDRAAARAAEEENRLLYVALTRARQRLIICGWQPRGERIPEQSWYAHCARAFDLLEDVRLQPDGRRRLDHHGEEPDEARSEVPSASPPPSWAGTAPLWQARPPPPEPAGRRSLAPSRPDGAVFGPLPPATSPRARAGRASGRRRGEILHALLQHLPDLPLSDRPGAARRFARRRLDEPDADALAREALAVLAHPLLTRLFGPLGRAEQRLAGRVGDLAVTGIVDRIAIGPDAIDLVDFKSGRPAPRDVARTPVHYLRQMSAYRGVLQSLRPGVPITCLLVWTLDAAVVALPDALLDAHAPLA